MQERAEAADFAARDDLAPCGLFTASADGRLVRVNATFCRWMGLPAAVLLGGKSFQDLLTVGGRIFLQTHLAPLLELQRSIAEVKLDLLRADGTAVPTLINVLRTEDGRFDHFAAMVVNDRHKYERELLSARARAEEALQAKENAERALKSADRRKDEFLATLAHELRNPFGAMRTVVDLLRRPWPGGDDFAWCLQVLDRQLEQATRLTDDLLDVSRIAEGKIEIELARVELGSVMTEAVESARARYFEHGATHDLRVEIPEGPVYVRGDALRLSQIMLNVLNNALRYTPAGGTIWMSASKSAEEVVVTVKDNGVGISADVLPTIFDMFVQARSERVRASGGLGIGLSLVRELVKLHGGHIAASSGGIGKGSVFEVRLPVAEEAAFAVPTPTTGARTARTPRRVLMVDDNIDAAESLSLLLASEGHQVRSASDGFSALRVSDEFIPDAVILDIGLPDIEGDEVARRIRKKRGVGVTLIALTGWAPSAEAAETRTFNAYFTKPVDIDALLDTLDRRD
ncbi:hybrid sensor histidine kinase/response regulator [Caballeronia cordobensis]|uniref:hybrid sensor histidine kinase/response regulator n=1 Tax=Caballeronia cordobensis TaxID=1353886 RepID=UPI0006AD6317|nr:ATP-binding protein [Caballeronia cordobensis]